MEKQPNSVKSVEMALRSLAVTGRANASAMNMLSDGLEFCAEQLKDYEASRRARLKPPKRASRKKHGSTRSNC